MKTTLKVIFGFMAFCVLIVLIFGNDDKKATVKVPEELTNSQIFYFAKDQIKQRLKAPSSAEFSDDYNLQGSKSDSIYQVKSTVESQNSFGAQLRSYYMIKMKYVGGYDWSDDRSWQVIDCQIFQ